MNQGQSWTVFNQLRKKEEVSICWHFYDTPPDVKGIYVIGYVPQQLQCTHPQTSSKVKFCPIISTYSALQAKTEVHYCFMIK